MNDPRQCAQRFLGQAGAILFLGSMLGGGYVALAKTGKIDVDAHATVAAHLNAMLGAFWLFAVAWSVPHLGYGATGLRRLAWLVIVPTYGNWLVTSVKAALKVSGIDFIGEAKNDAVFVALISLVVVPSLVASAAWVVGYRRGRAPAG